MAWDPQSWNTQRQKTGGGYGTSPFTPQPQGQQDTWGAMWGQGATPTTQPKPSGVLTSPPAWSTAGSTPANNATASPSPGFLNSSPAYNSVASTPTYNSRDDGYDEQSNMPTHWSPY